MAIDTITIVASVTSCVLAFVGALVLAFNAPWSRWAWPVWTVAAVAGIVTGWRAGQWDTVAMQGISLVICLIGCVHWLFVPWIEELLDWSLGERGL